MPSSPRSTRSASRTPDRARDVTLGGAWRVLVRARRRADDRRLRRVSRADRPRRRGDVQSSVGRRRSARDVADSRAAVERFRRRRARRFATGSSATQHPLADAQRRSRAPATACANSCASISPTIVRCARSRCGSATSGPEARRDPRHRGPHRSRQDDARSRAHRRRHRSTARGEAPRHHDRARLRAARARWHRHDRRRRRPGSRGVRSHDGRRRDGNRSRAPRRRRRRRRDAADARAPRDSRAARRANAASSRSRRPISSTTSGSRSSKRTCDARRRARFPTRRSSRRPSQYGAGIRRACVPRSRRARASIPPRATMICFACRSIARSRSRERAPSSRAPCGPGSVDARRDRSHSSRRAHGARSRHSGARRAARRGDRRRAHGDRARGRSTSPTCRVDRRSSPIAIGAPTTLARADVTLVPGVDDRRFARERGFDFTSGRRRSARASSRATSSARRTVRRANRLRRAGVASRRRPIRGAHVGAARTRSPAA